MTKTGNDLIALGYKPGKWFGKALAHINEYQLSNEQIKIFMDTLIPQHIDPHAEAVFYHKNIEAQTEEESKNIAAVFKSMDELMKTPTIVDGAIMPDACPTGGGNQIPVGGIAVTKNAIHPGMHSADICCSVMMTNFGFVDPKKVLDAANSVTHFGGGGRADHSKLPTEIRDRMLDNYFLSTEKSMQVSTTHLGTQGDGNHFLFVGQSEQTGETIMVTHHGSRGLGANLYKNGMQIAEKFRAEIAPKVSKANAWIPYDTNIGKQYWEALQIVRSWTKLNHLTLHQETEKLIHREITDHFWNEHNFVFKKDDLFFHAKGATPLDEAFVPDSSNGRRLIPLNMSEPILIVTGQTTANNLGFAPHGAGRSISRSKHIAKLKSKSVKEILHEETAGLDLRFFSGEPDISELPSAYKSAEAVQKQMSKFNLGTIQDRIIPYGSIMAGNWKINAPWRKKKK